jgi:antagonist of KipI
MADRPTVGGYSRLGQVIRADLPKAGQLWIGHLVRFLPVTIAQARAALLEQEAVLSTGVT